MPHNHSMGRPLGYARVSTKDQTTVPEQLRWMEQTAQERGLLPPEQFIDDGIAGDEVALRPGLQALLRRAEERAHQGDPAGVAFWWLPDRFSRASALATASALNVLVEAGVKLLVTASGEIDLTDSKALVMLLIEQEFSSAGFSPKMSLNVLRSLAEKVKAGLWPNGRTPYGFATVAGRLVPGPAAEVAAVRSFFADYATGTLSLSDLVRKTREGGIMGRKGIPFTRGGMRMLLRRLLYIGVYVWNTRHEGKFSRFKAGRVEPDQTLPERKRERARAGHSCLGTVYNGPEDTIRNDHFCEPIIEREQWDQVQRLLKLNRDHCSPHKDPQTVFTGRLWCGHCGSRVQQGAGISHQPTGVYLYCRNRRELGAKACSCGGGIRQAVVLQRVIDRLKTDLLSPGAMEALVARLNEGGQRAAGQLGEEVAALAVKVRELATRQRESESAYLDAPADLRPALVKVLRERKEQCEQCSLQLATKEGQLRQRQESLDPEKPRKAVALVQILDQVAGEGDPKKLRAALAALVSRVEMWVDKAGRGKAVCRVKVTLAPEFAVLFYSAGSGRHDITLIDPAA